ncbi:MOSC domain-containing protein [Rhizobium sp. YIM 134829]|uniref:MOSC domain-containing protein n=1 Tax=Rhizobium sp. YIM 134829 TaxID=3390453 RepID=UPI003978A32F
MSSIIAVARDGEHNFSKRVVESLNLVSHVGVEGDAHAGTKVKHRSRVAVDPNQPNLRQVHLIHGELLIELSQKGYSVKAGDLGENILTEGIDLLSLPTDTILELGSDVKLRVTGLRNPCAQIDTFQPGLLKEVAYIGKDDELVRRAGIMTVVLAGGKVQPGHQIRTVLPPLPHRRLERV